MDQIFYVQKNYVTLSLMRKCTTGDRFVYVDDVHVNELKPIFPPNIGYFPAISKSPIMNEAFSEVA